MVQIDISEEVRFAAGIGIVVANWYVFRGVSLEESDDPWTRDTGKILLRRALLAETVFALGLLFIDSWISIGQKAEIIRLTTPRDLSPDAVRRVQSTICPYGSMPYDMTTVTLDERLFFNELDQIFKKCAWKPQGAANRDAMIASLSRLVGVRIWYSPRQATELGPVSNAFAGALTKEGIIDARAEPIPDSAKIVTTAIEIQIGQRP